MTDSTPHGLAERLAPITPFFQVIESNIALIGGAAVMTCRPQDLRDVAEIHENWVGLDVPHINELMLPYGVAWRPVVGEAVLTRVEC